MQSNAKQCKAMQSNAKQCKAMQSKANQCKTVQSKAMQRNAKQCNAMQSNAKQSNAKQSKATKPLHVTPSPFSSQTPETVTCDTSLLPPSQNPERLYNVFGKKKEIPNWGRAGFIFFRAGATTTV